MIETWGGLKGGIGKTTLATNRAVFLSNQGGDVLLVDADDQRTATKFTACRDATLDGATGYTSMILTGGKELRREINNLRSKFTHIVIDCGGRDTNSLRAAISVADAFIIPFNPRSFDIWTAEQVGEIVAELLPGLEIIGHTLRVYACLNRCDVRGDDNRQAAEFLKTLPWLQYLEQIIINRKSIATAAGNGLAVSEYEPKDKKAIKELDELFTFITKAYDNVEHESTREATA